MSSPAVSGGGPSGMRRAMRVLRTEGLKGMADRILDRGRNAIKWHFIYVFSYPIHPDLPIPPLKAEIQIETVGPEDMDTIRDMASMFQEPTTPDEIQFYLKQGEFCYVGKANGHVVGYFWFRLGGVVQEYGKLLYKLKPDEVYFHNAYVIAEQRGKNINPAVKAFAAREFSQKYGKKRMITFIEWFNKPSIRTTRKLGETLMGRIVLIKVHGRKYSFWLTRSRAAAF